MMEKFTLKRTIQCPKCPWRVDSNPYEIPGGYDVEKHKNLSCTIAEPGNILAGTKAMACHHSSEDNSEYCIGWIHNQLGAGNNISLRMRMRNCANISEIKVIGEQHRRFEDTLPEE